MAHQGRFPAIDVFGDNLSQVSQSKFDSRSVPRLLRSRLGVLRMTAHMGGRQREPVFVHFAHLFSRSLSPMLSGVLPISPLSPIRPAKGCFLPCFFHASYSARKLGSVSMSITISRMESPAIESTVSSSIRSSSSSSVGTPPR